MPQNGLVRVGTYSIEEVLNNIAWYQPGDLEKYTPWRQFGEFRVKMKSQRYILFAKKGICCVKCGIEGRFFSLDEQTIGDRKCHHFNLMALDSEGNEVLMTKDHILPKSKGGKDHIDNYQTMCTICNGEKGNTLEE